MSGAKARAADAEEGVRRFAAGHFGLVPYRTALSAGMSPGAVKSRVAARQWAAVGRGLYRVAGAPVVWEQRLLAACFLAGPSAVASHRSAGALWGLPGGARGRPEVTVAACRSGTRAAPIARVHHTRRLDPRDRGVWRGIPVTSPARTLVDLAGRVPHAVLAEAVDDAICRRLVTLGEVETRLRVFGASRHGLTSLRSALEAWTPGPLPGSVAEMRIIRCLREHRIPAPERQYEVHDQGRFVARVDAAWPWARVALEMDSWRWHGSSTRFHHDLRRRLALGALGWQVVTATANCTQGGGEDLVAAVRRALDRGAGGTRR